MPRKPNYSFERSQRAKCKAAKKAERLQAKADKLAARRERPDETEAATGTETQDSQEH